MGRDGPLRVICHHVTSINNSLRHRLSRVARTANTRAERSASTHVLAQVRTFGSTHLWTLWPVHTELTCSILTFLHCLEMTPEIPSSVSTQETEGIRADIEQLSNCTMVAAGCRSCTYFACSWPLFHSDSFIYFCKTENTNIIIF